MQSMTVVICCHNSSGRLRPTLEHLARQDADSSSWEVVVVDNASTDSTAQTALELWKEFGEPAPLKVVREDKPGLSHARTRGVAEARYETIGFVDDDNWLDPRWVCLAAQIMAENPQIGLLGSGNIEPVFEHQVPEWVNKFAPMLACSSMPGDALQVIVRGGTVAGAGMVTRKTIFRDMRERYGNFQTTGRKGASTASGEDIEFAYVVSILGWKIARHPGLRMRHFIPNGRIRPDYLRKLLVSIGQAANLLHPLRRFATSGGTPASAFLSYGGLIVASVVYGCGETWRAIGWGRGSTEHDRMVAAGRKAQLAHLLGCFAEYRAGFRKAQRFAATSRRWARVKQLSVT
jgi:hypothetical protein